MWVVAIDSPPLIISRTMAVFSSVDEISCSCHCFLSSGLTIPYSTLQTERGAFRLAEEDLRSQLVKYVHIDSFSPTLGSSINVTDPVDDESYCLVFDQCGIYVTRDGEFVEYSIDEPLIGREGIPQLGVANRRRETSRRKSLMDRDVHILRQPVIRFLIGFGIFACVP
jgi:hypothetical protein